MNAVCFSDTNIVGKPIKHEIFDMSRAGSGREAVAQNLP